MNKDHETTKLIDTHAHLDHVNNMEQALSEAKACGVCAIVAPAEDLTTCKKNLEIQRNFHEPKIFLAFGIHPGTLKIEEVDETMRWIREHRPYFIAIGEIGLDFWYRWVRHDDEKKAQQKRVFQLQLDLANEYDLPVIIHSRGAWKECFAMTKSANVKKAVFHWYSGPTDVLRDILDSGYFISATPALFYSPQAQEAVRQAPMEQVLIETDSPVRYRLSEDKNFEAGPKDVFMTLQAYANIKQADSQQAAFVLNENAKNFFNLSL